MLGTTKTAIYGGIDQSWKVSCAPHLLLGSTSTAPMAMPAVRSVFDFLWCRGARAVPPWACLPRRRLGPLHRVLPRIWPYLENLILERPRAGCTNAITLLGHLDPGATTWRKLSSYGGQSRGCIWTLRHPHLIQPYLAYTMTTWHRTMGVLGAPIYLVGAISSICRYLNPRSMEKWLLYRFLICSLWGVPIQSRPHTIF
jgi:hypothetical protein